MRNGALKAVFRTIGFLIACAAIVISAKNLTASFSVPDTYTTVEIDNVVYGQFDHIDGLDRIYSSQEPFAKISFQRNFVTEPSLYLWAKNNVAQRDGQKKIHLVERSETGEEISRLVLESCHPLSWSVEAAQSSAGGFREFVEIAVAPSQP